MSLSKKFSLSEKIICQEVSNLVIEASEMAALSAFKLNGMGRKNDADKLAVDAMRKVLQTSSMGIKVVIGEGEMDEAPMLFIGEELGQGEMLFDLAVDPLEGTNLCANNMPNAITSIAISEKSGILAAPDCYMEKIASGKVKEDGVINVETPLKENLKNLAKYLKKDISDLNITMLDRPRHKERIAEIRSLGAKVSLISDGDIYGIIATTGFGNGADLYLGSGGAPEGVLAAAAIKACGGQMSGKLLFETEEQRSRAVKYGISNPDKPLSLNEMIKGNCIFAASGVTNGEMLKAPTFCGKTNFWKVETIVFSFINNVPSVQKILHFKK